MKKIAVSMKVAENRNYIEFNNVIDFLYIDFFEKLNYLPILVPNNTKFVKNYLELDDVDALVLTGGNNVDPNLYAGEDNLNDVYSVRDEAEIELLKYALERNIKIIGICRGFQMINVYFGGSLSHRVPDHVRKDHILLSVDNDLDGKITNTYHNQGIRDNDLAGNLVKYASSEDGLIEAFIDKSRNILGVQWHPERQNEDFDKKLITDFLGDKL